MFNTMFASDLVTRMEIKFKYYMFNINANIDIVMEQVSLLISDNNVRNIIIQCPTIQTRTVLSAALHANLIRSDSECEVRLKCALTNVTSSSLFSSIHSVRAKRPNHVGRVLLAA